MRSRMDKYYDTVIQSEDTNEEVLEQLEEQRESRTRRNDQLYKEVSALKIESFDVNSNVSVIGKSSKNIDIQDVQDILDKKYHEKPKKKSFGDSEMKDIPRINLDETREYDINSIMEKARAQKQVNYEEDRLKKLRNTQYDILKSLDLGDSKEEAPKEIEEEPRRGRKTNKELLSLIDTITTKELISEKTLAENSIKEDVLKGNTAPINNEDVILDNTITSDKELDPLDILSDLRGDDENTRVLGINELREAEEKEELEKTSDVKATTRLQKRIDIEASEEAEEALAEKNITKAEQILKEEQKEKEEKKEETDEEATSDVPVLSKTNSFDDFADLREDMKITRMLVKILIVILVLVFIAGCIFIADKYLGLGLF